MTQTGPSGRGAQNAALLPVPRRVQNLRTEADTQNAEFLSPNIYLFRSVRGQEGSLLAAPPPNCS